jgi:hypothetical protein
LPPDDSLAEGIPPSPIGRARIDLPDPSPSLLSQEVSPSLDSITEEQELEQPFTPLTNTSKAASASKENVGPDLASLEGERAVNEAKNETVKPAVGIQEIGPESGNEVRFNVPGVLRH